MAEAPYVCTSVDRGKRPWNKGLLIGQKKPLETRQVWSMRDDVTHQMKKASRNIFYRPSGLTFLWN